MVIRWNLKSGPWWSSGTAKEIGMVEVSLNAETGWIQVRGNAVDARPSERAFWGSNSHRDKAEHCIALMRTRRR